jgi:protein ImuB
MSRVISIWLPFWKTDRLERQGGGLKLHEPSPLAVIAKGKGGKRLLALNAGAREAGLRSGMLLTDACAMLPSLTTAPHDSQAECLELKRLAASCNRFSPWTAPDEPDGLWIEATGLAHLFGGEDALLRHILHYLHGLGFTARAAMAGTPGAAWGLARFAKSPCLIVPPGEEARHLAPMPVKALRIDADSAALLVRLGLTTIGQIVRIPRASLRARLGKAITCRLDQALGRQGEALSPLMPEPVYAARLEFADPLTAMEGLEQTARILIESVAEKLKADGKGARRFSLVLFDTQNGRTEMSVRMARPSGEPKHIGRVFKEKLAALEGRFDPTLGFDAAALYAMRAEPLQNRQTDLLDCISENGDGGERIAQFLDRVTARLGEKAATRFAFEESHWPERAASHVPAGSPARAFAAPALSMPRPLTLLPRPEPIGVIALVPDYPPRKFVWRRCHHKVAKAEGPERISPEWWSGEQKVPSARDYYRVEDEKGQRFWLYRERVNGEGEEQRWFLHGLFA